MTFEFQNALKKLPLVPFDAIAQKFVLTVSPLLTDEQRELAEREINEYLSLRGHKHFEGLETLDKSVDNYLHQFWEDAYLKDDSSLVLNVNPIFIFEDDPTPARNNQIARASSLLFSTFKFISAVRNESLAPDVWRKTPLCMSQFKRLFATARLPRNNLDEIKTFPESKHILVVNEGAYYVFDVLDNLNNAYMTQREIALNLDKILKDDERACSDVGLLTGLTRNKWATLREELSIDNRATLDLIDSALLVLCLDDFETDRANVNEQVSSSLCGKVGEENISCSRWYDKLQLIVTKSGQASVNFEHSVVDGHTVLRFVSDVFTDTIIRFAKTISGTRVENFLTADSIDSQKSPFKRRLARQVKRLTFKLSPILLKEIVYAREFLEDVSSTLKVATLESSSYGKSFITGFKMSPDAFVQMSILATYFTLYGRLDNTYESVLTKVFKLGRTEVGRSVSHEALKFVKFYADLNSSRKVGPFSKEDTEKLIKLLRDALRKHTEIIRSASGGQGIDRILFALSKFENTQGSGKSKFFESYSYKKLTRSVISTSNCGNPSLRFFGFGPVVEEGFGIGYVIKDESLNYCISSYQKRPKRFAQLLQRYLDQIHDLIFALEPRDFELETDKIRARRQNSYLQEA